MHYTVLVVTAECPIDNTDVIDRALAPFNEDPSEPEFLEEINVTSEAESDYQDALKNEPTLTLEAFVADFYGSNSRVEDGQVLSLRARNPRWDWYQIGGRWSCSMKAKDVNPAIVGVGSRSLMDHEATKPGWFDQLQKSNLDLDGMKQEAADDATTLWTTIHTVLREEPTLYLNMELAFDSEEGSKLRHRLSTNPGWVTLKGLYHQHTIRILIKEVANVTLADFVESARAKSVFSTYATLIDGEWTEHEGDNKPFAELFVTIPDDHWLTVVDCHT